MNATQRHTIIRTTITTTRMVSPISRLAALLPHPTITAITITRMATTITMITITRMPVGCVAS
jgi:hypothetical protein